MTTASPPTTAEVAADLAAWLGGQSAVLTDFNQGSQVRTDAEALGSVIEMQAVITQAEAFQAMVKAAWSAFNIFPLAAIKAVGSITFVTGTGANPPPSPYDVLIPQGTVVQTVGGTQFATVTDVILPVTGTTVFAVIAAVIAGSAGNVPAGAITQIASALPVPLSVSNAAPTSGGAEVESPPDTMARFTAVVQSLGRADPVAVANACIGVAVAGSLETCVWSTVYEPWIALAAQGVTPLPAGFQVYIDNGSGAASPDLIAAVTARLNGDLATGQEGYRPAGVPYSVSPVVPVFASVTVTGTTLYPGLTVPLTAAVSDAIISYFAGLAFGEAAEYSTLLPVIANQVAGNVTVLTVTLLDAFNDSVQTIQPPGTGRVILQRSSVIFT